MKRNKSTDTKILKLYSAHKRLRDPLYKKYLKYITHFLDDDAVVSQRIWHIQHNIMYIPVCVVCNSKKKWRTGRAYLICSDSDCAKYTHHNITNKQTCLKRYGVDNPSKIPSIIKKIQSTNLKKYGHVCSIHNPKVYEKCRATWRSKYGHDHFSSSDIIKSKKDATFYYKYGVKNQMQVPEIRKRSFDNMLRKGTFNKTIKFNDHLSYHGSYEHDFLLKFEHLHKITEPISTIDYKFKEKICNYTPDFYMPDMNMIVEIKSQWTFDLHKERNLAKQDECLKQGFDFIFIVDKKYEEFLKKV